MISFDKNVVMLDKNLLKSFLHKREQNSNKGDYGKLLNICGSKTMCGAAMMSTLAALRIGVGTTTLASTQYVIQNCAAHLMEAMTIPLEESAQGSISQNAIPTIMNAMAGKTACLLGCGLSVDDETKQIVKYIVENTDCNLILDADAINVIADDKNILLEANEEIVLTPHIGEMARLTGLTIEQIKSDSVSIARSFADEFDVVLVLKDTTTLIALPNGMVYQNQTGNAGLAKGGSGDVLAGMIAGLVAQGISPSKASACAVLLHGMLADSLAGRMSQYSMLARDLINEIPTVLKALGL